jgi:SEC-C motif-containing protein
MINCPCASNKKYVDCCEPYISYKKRPSTPEALMRSRYTAYTKANIDYIKKTMRGRALFSFQEIEAKSWAERVVWLKLTVLQASCESPTKGYVEFIALFIDAGILNSIHEKSEFIQEDGQWYYVDGIQFPIKSVAISRNAACPCGSQRKFKSCHGKI